MIIEKSKEVYSTIQLLLMIAVFGLVGTETGSANDGEVRNPVFSSPSVSTLDPLKALGIDERRWLAMNHQERASLLVSKVREGSRMDLYSALILIRRDISSYRTRREAEPFLRILPEFSDLAEERDLSSIGPNLLKETAESLTNHMLRPAWLKLESDTLETVKLFHRWATNIAADAYATDLIHLLGLNDPLRYNVDFSESESRHFAENVEYLIQWAIAERTPSLGRSYQFLISVFAKFKLRNIQQMSLEARVFWVSKLRDEGTISNVLLFLREEAVRVTSDPEQLEPLAQVLIELKSHVDALSNGTTSAGDRTYIPEYLRLEGPSQLAGDLLFRALTNLYNFSEPQFRQLLGMLQVSGLETYATRVREFLNRGEGSPRFIKQFLVQVDALLKQMRLKNLYVSATELERKTGKVAAGVEAKLNNAEGTYFVTASDGEEYRLVIAFADKTRIIAGLGRKNFGTVVRFGFMNVNYSYEDQLFVATEEVQSTEDNRNQWMQFVVDGDEVRGQFYVPLKGFQKFRGRRTERFQDYLAQEHQNAESVYGRYAGTMTCRGGRELNVELGIVKFPDQRMYGTLSLVSTSSGGRELSSRMDFQDGLYDRRKGVVYLTGKSNNRTVLDWLQIRGVVRNGKFYGQYIIGAYGANCSNIVLDKVEAADDF